MLYRKMEPSRGNIRSQLSPRDLPPLPDIAVNRQSVHATYVQDYHRHSQQRVTIEDGIVVRGSGTSEQGIMVRCSTSYSLYLGINGYFFHMVRRRRPKALKLTGSSPSGSGFSRRVGAIVHQHEGSVRVGRSVTPPNKLLPRLSTRKPHYDGRRQ